MRAVYVVLQSADDAGHWAHSRRIFNSISLIYFIKYFITTSSRDFVEKVPIDEVKLVSVTVKLRKFKSIQVMSCQVKSSKVELC